MMNLEQLQQLIAGYDPSKNGYTQNTDGSRPNGWYKNDQGSDNPVASNPFGGGTAFEKYLSDNGVDMWDPGNPGFGRVGATNKQAFDYLHPGASIIGTGSQIAGADPSLSALQFHTGGGPALGNFFAGKDYGDHTGINKLVETVGPMIPLLMAGGAGLLASGAGGAGAAAEGVAGGAGAGVGGGAGGGFLPEAAGFSSPGAMTTMAGSFADPATLAMSTGAPMSSTASLMSGSGSFLPGASQILPINSAFSLDDFTAKTPTTGNKLVDNLLSKAASTALQSSLTAGASAGAGAANQLTAGTGGDTTAADQQAADEARKQSLIDQINQMYTPENFNGEEDDLSKAIRGQSGDALKLGYEKAARATTFDAARRGNVGGSVMADNISNLNRDNQLGATKIEDAVNSALAGLRSSRLASQGNAISLVNAGSGPEGVNAAATGIRNAIDTARAEKVPDVTQGLFQNVALSNQAINTGNNNASLNGYINARTGGGSLFPLGKSSSGYNVQT